MSRIEKKFKELKQDNKKAFIAFITAGYPNLDLTYQLVLEFSRIGVDIIELGVPFSDPIADGPVIQESSQAALRNGVNLNNILALVKQSRRYTEVPVCLMTYFNPVFCFGENTFIKKAQDSGVDGLIIPDFPPEEAGSFSLKAKKADLDTVFFVSPTTTAERVKYIAEATRGFIYYVSLTGVTGRRASLSSDLKDNLSQIKKITSVPVCVGFGISAADQVRQVYRIADGAIVGSAIIEKIKENIGRPDLVKNVGSFVYSLKV